MPPPAGRRNPAPGPRPPERIRRFSRAGCGGRQREHDGASGVRIGDRRQPRVDPAVGVGAGCRRYGMGRVTPRIRVVGGPRLIDDDYGVLRKFRGESALRTYLVVVVARSPRVPTLVGAVARRPRRGGLRAVAVRLEKRRAPRRSYRRWPGDRAARTPARRPSRHRQLAALFADPPAPRRGRPAEALLDALVHVPDPPRRRRRRDGERARRPRGSRSTRRCADALHALSAEDRADRAHALLGDGASVAEIARALGVAQNRSTGGWSAGRHAAARARGGGRLAAGVGRVPRGVGRLSRLVAVARAAPAARRDPPPGRAARRADRRPPGRGAARGDDRLARPRRPGARDARRRGGGLGELERAARAPVRAPALPRA